MRRLPPLALLLAVLSLAACLPALARPLVQLDLVDRDTGQWLPSQPHRGERWIAGDPGHRYAVRLTNTSGERVLVVLSVDGVNAITGQTASPSQAGYVLGPWESAEITGWRKSMGEVAQFVFSAPHDSYASRTGRPRNVGVIGIAVYTEAAPHRQPPSAPPIAGAQARAAQEAAAATDDGQARRAASADAYSVPAPSAPPGIGTGHGARESSWTQRTHFVRSARPAQIEQLRYDTRENLIARGILRERRMPPWPRPAPQAFPQGFVADPPYRR